jgi:hypothetical protein
MGPTVICPVVRTMQSEATRRREQELVKLKKDFELLSVQHESSEASLRKRHQEALSELSDQVEQLNKYKARYVCHSSSSGSFVSGLVRRPIQL